MLDPWAGRILLRLLPRTLGRDVFEPAWEDLRFGYLERRSRARGRFGKAANEARHAVLLAALFVDCIRVHAVARIRESRSPGPSPPRLPSTRSGTSEPLAMVASQARQAFRQLFRAPGFAVAAVLTLALGVGANVAVFAVIEALVLRPLPYPDGEELVILEHRDERTGIAKEFIAIGDYVDLAARQSSLESLSGYGSRPWTLSDHGDPFRVHALLAGPGLLDTLRARAALGRNLEPADSLPGAEPVMLIGHALWLERFGGDDAVVGRSVRLGEHARRVVGVMPASFGFPPDHRTDVIVPMSLPLAAPADRKESWTFAVGRRRADTTLEAAAADLSTISKSLEREHPESNLASTYSPVPLRDSVLGSTRPALFLLFAAVGALLLIACVNVSNLLLARWLARRREIALRVAMGAGLARLVLQVLTESLVLSCVAGVTGTLAAYWGTGALSKLLPVPSDVRINAAVLGFTLLIIIATSLGTGLVAALALRSRSPAESLGESSRVTMSAFGRRANGALVVVEVAFAIVLLMGAGLVLRSFAALVAVDPGFRAERVMTIPLQLPADRYDDVEKRDAFYRRAFEELSALADVQAVGAAAVVPLTGNNWTVSFERPESPVPPGERPPEVGWQAASRGYFETLGIPLVEGRLFDASERPGGAPAVIVSEAVQKQFFSDGSAVGREVAVGSRRFHIVGVVGNIRRAALEDAPRADMYFPFETNPDIGTTFFVRTSAEPERALASIRAVLRALEPQCLILDARSLAEIANDSMRVTRTLLLLLGIFAAAALSLAAVGIYGVMSCAVRLRVREIGMRMALGASRRGILWLVLAQGITIAVTGCALGLAAGLGLAALVGSRLFGVTPTDPLTISVAVTVLVLTLLAACYIPARRAASVDPAKTLTAY